MRDANRILAAVGAGNALVAAASFGVASAGPQLREGFGVGTQGLGVLLAAMPLGLMLGTFAWGVAADAIGERRTLTLAWCAAVLALVLAAAVAWPAWNDEPTTAQLTSIGATFLLFGIAGSSSHSAGGRAITEAFPERLHGRVLSIRHTFIPVGGAAGGALIPWALHHTGLGELLLAAAGLATVVTVSMRLTLPADDGAVGIDTDATALDAAADGEMVAPGVGEARGPSPLARPELWLLTGSCSMFALVQLGLMGFLTIHLVDEAGLSVAGAATIFAAAQLVGAAGRIALGDLSDRIGNPIRVLRVLAVAGVLVAAIALVAPARAEGLLLALLLALFTSWNGVAVAAAARLAPAGRMGSTLGMQTTVNAAMGVVAPIGAGTLLAASGWGAVEAVVITAFVVAMAGLALLRRRVR